MIPATCLLLLGVLSPLIRAQQSEQIVLEDTTTKAVLPEADDFDIVQALKEKNVDISTIPSLNKPTESTACAAACNALDTIFGKQSVLQASSSDELNDFLKGYWSNNQAETIPACVFKPTNDNAVAVAVLVSRLTECPFVVKSGGHASFPGASNIEGGITISFENMKRLELSEDQSTVTVEPGWRWGALYYELAKSDLTVVGGRVADVGIGGLTTGGGISFLSNLYGWACDNIASMNLLTSTGSIITASPSENPDLFSALRGAGSNLGIITSFTLKTYPLPGGQIWGGTRTYLPSMFPAALHAFTTLVSSSSVDPKAGGWLAFIRYNGSDLCMAELYYAQADGHNATIWRDYDAIPAVADDTANRHIGDYAVKIEASSPPGFREYFYVMTVRNDEELNAAAVELFFDSVGDLEKLPGAFSAFILQSITTEQMRHMKRHGGNALGLNEEKGPLTLMLLNPRWVREEDDEGVYAFGSELFKKIKRMAEDRGLQSDYLYMNYASEYQDVIGSYGEEGRKKVHEAAAKWDPKRVFQTLMPGYFKLEGPPTKGTEMFSF
ncbi:FAD-binding domain-containing protein 31 [Elsinoe fawcettii]|nr:FAD-binding domain-containing protein 31 [Elsinoe fawcettii]